MNAQRLFAASRARRSLIVRSLLQWYKKNGRPLPWRRTADPYVILLSEVMLQQTQVERVVKKLPEFRRLFPSLGALARAQRGDVIRAWGGLGYNNRAIRLHQLAQSVCRHGRGRLPRSIDELRKLPGIGPYTAHAIAAFAYGEDVAVVDTNVRRVLGRLFPRESRVTEAWSLARIVLPRGNAYAWNQALMDLGSTVCTARNPGCAACPLEHHCPSAHRVAHEPPRRRPEPSRDGIPNRIYRGRIVQALRALDGRRSVELAMLGTTIKRPFLARDRRWLEDLLSRLERDDLVRLRKNNGTLYVSLPR